MSDDSSVEGYEYKEPKSNCEFWRNTESVGGCCLRAWEIMAEVETWLSWRRNLWIERARWLREKEGLDSDVADWIAFDHFRVTTAPERLKARKEWNERHQHIPK